MMSPDRRAKGLEIAANLIRRVSGEERIPTARELVQYAKVLDDYMLNGTVPEAEVQVELS